MSISCNSPCNNSYANYFPECKTITIAQLNSTEKLTESCYNIKGYISKVKTCPPCPKGYQCKPCPPDAIYISNEYQDKIIHNKFLQLNTYYTKKDKFKKGDYGIFSFLNNNENSHLKNLSYKNYSLIGYQKHYKSK